jgi:hypothetical protein
MQRDDSLLLDMLQAARQIREYIKWAARAGLPQQPPGPGRRASSVYCAR